jgi:hypothetical protein
MRRKNKTDNRLKEGYLELHGLRSKISDKEYLDEIDSDSGTYKFRPSGGFNLSDYHDFSVSAFPIQLPSFLRLNYFCILRLRGRPFLLQE